MTEIAVLEILIPGVQGPIGATGPEGDVTEDLEALVVRAEDAAEASEVSAEDSEASAATATIQASRATTARVGAEAGQVAAELAAGIAEALTTGRQFDDTTAGIAGTVDGQWFATPTDPPDGSMTVWKNVAEVAVQKAVTASGASISALKLRVDGIEPKVNSVLRRYFGAPADEIPAFTFNKNGVPGYYNTYFKDDGTGNWNLVSPATIDIDRIRSTGAMPSYSFSDEVHGRKIVSADNAIIRSIDPITGVTQIGPIPLRKMSAELENGKIWVMSEGVNPFAVGGEFPGINRGVRMDDLGHVSWFNETSKDFKTISVMKGFRKPFSPFRAGATPLLGTVSHGVLLLGTGQSTIYGSGNNTVLTADCPLPGQMYVWDVGSRFEAEKGPRVLPNGNGPTHIYEPVNRRRLSQLIDCHESKEEGAGESQLSMACYEYLQRMGNTYATVAAIVGIGSQPYDNIKIGTVPGDNLAALITDTYIMFKLLGLTFDVKILWPQHEGNVLNSQSLFLTKIVEFQSQVSTLVNGITNGEVPQTLFVMNDFTNGTNYDREFTEQGLAQVQFSLENDTKGVIASPCFVFDRDPTDGTHYTASSGAHNGSYMGRVAANFDLDRDALPLYTTSVVIESPTRIRGTMHRPFGATTITATSPIVSDPGHLGFRVARTDTGEVLDIDDAFIDGDDWVVDMLSPLPTDVHLGWSVGLYGTSGNQGGPDSGARTPINDGNADVNFYGLSMRNHHVGQQGTVIYS